jgi:large subunit ribosomal protein L31e
MERTYTIPLRKGWLKASKYRRAKKAVNTLREFLVKHMKSDDVRLMPELNLEVWKHGMRNPPSRVKVNVSKDDKGVVKAQLFGVPMVQEVKEEKKGIVKKLAEKMTGKEAKPAEAPKTEAKPAAAKPAEPKKAPEKKAEPA